MEDLLAQDFVSRSLIHPVLSDKDTADLLGKAQRGDKEATELLIINNQKLVASIARKYYNRDGSNLSVEFCDLMQVGNVGLEKAIKRWDPEKGVKFDTYAYYWIRAYVRRFSVHLQTGYSLSFGYAERLMKIRRARSVYLSENNREPSPAELQSALPGILMRDITTGLMAIQRTLRIIDLENDSINDDDELKPVVIASEEKSTEDAALDQAVLSVAKKYITQLPETWQMVMRHRYEIDGCQFMTARALADRLGVTRQFIENVEVRALKRLKTLILSDT